MATPDSNNEIIPDLSDGSDLYEAGSPARSHSVEFDPGILDGAAYAHDPEILSGTEINEVASQLKFVSWLLRRGLGSISAIWSGSDPLPAGTLLYISGYSEADDAYYISKADISDTDTYPKYVSVQEMEPDVVYECYKNYRLSLDTGSSYSAGDRVYASNTPGELTNVPTTVPVPVGWYLGDNVFEFML